MAHLDGRVSRLELRRNSAPPAAEVPLITPDMSARKAAQIYLDELRVRDRADRPAASCEGMDSSAAARLYREQVG